MVKKTEKNKEENIDTTIKKTFKSSKVMTKDELDEKAEKLADKVGKVKLYGSGPQYEAYAFMIDQILYNSMKGHEFKISIMYAMTEVDREYTLYFHARDFGLFTDAPGSDNYVEEKLMNVFVSKMENKSAKTILTLAPLDPVDTIRLLQNLIGTEKHKILLIPKGVMHKFDYEKARSLVHDY